MIRGEIRWANFGIPYGSEAGYTRPAIDRSKIKEKISKVSREIMDQVEVGIKLVLGI